MFHVEHRRLVKKSICGVVFVARHCNVVSNYALFFAPYLELKEKCSTWNNI